MRIKAVGILSAVLIGSLQGRSLIQELSVDHHRVAIKVHDSLKKRFLVEDFFVEYEKDIDLEKLPESIVILPFVLNIFSIVWASGDTYYLDSLDYDIYHSLQQLKQVYKQLYPKTQWQGRLIPRKVVATEPVKHLNHTTAVLFDGGLDARTAVHALKEKPFLLTTADKDEISFLSSELGNMARERFSGLSNALKANSTFVRSNSRSFLKNGLLNKISPEFTDWQRGTIGTIGQIGLVAPILYTQAHSLLRVPMPFFGDLPACYAQLMTFAGIAVKQDKSFVTCFDKLAGFVQLNNKKDRTLNYLMGCRKSLSENCTECSSCLATILGLYALGEDPQAYGFYISPDELRAPVEEYLSKSLLSRTEADAFGQIISKITKKLATEDPTVKNLDWIKGVTIQVNENASVHHLKSGMNTALFLKKESIPTGPSGIMAKLKNIITYYFG